MNPHIDAVYIWNIVSEDTGSKVVENLVGTQISATFKVAGLITQISATFKVAGTYYNIEVIEKGGENRGFETQAICKYVRREVRDLHEEDREIYFDAMEIFHTLSLEEGQKKYGERWINHKQLTLAHSKLFQNTDGFECSPWHAGPTFVTSHIAMALWQEQALQMINPTIATPYWDYIEDYETYGSNFTPGEFGAYQDYPWAVGGRWKDLRTSRIEPEDNHHTQHNSYGIITDEYNNNGDSFLTRADTICNWKPQYLEMPACKDIHSVLTSFSLKSTWKYIFYDVHSLNLHNLIGGAWDCPIDVGEVIRRFGGARDENGEFRETTKILERFLWGLQYPISSNMYWLDQWEDPGLCSAEDWLDQWEDPGLCSAEIPFEECRYHCKDFDEARIDEMTNDEVWADIERFGVYKDFEGIVMECGQDTPTPSCQFVNVTRDEDFELKRIFLKLQCSSAKISPWSSPLGSPDDPLFIPIHTYYDIFYQYLLLTKDDFSLAWEGDNSTCYGHHLMDRMPVPWFGFLGEHQNEAHNLTYTHLDLLRIFDPANARLPYVYAKFDWDYCYTDDKTDLYAK
eukprot:CAMPEP_0117849150 /NCGR_PEP_ID=MMETSP0949-20121206/20920_1 /TAXON_ID=44440 /ORGANISM="Chattonella subsalsa, Strain CCMP2191" /LENGTH=569 /DNA_ID=CAMNT_0005696297 /DNA_START=291 /DNA_END=1997 /DNA_ORIENTATION=+